jgi:hypothetical protein
MQLVANTKQNILGVISKLPDDVTSEDVMEKIFLLQKIKKGCEQADNNQMLSHLEVKRKMQEWLN